MSPDPGRPRPSPVVVAGALAEATTKALLGASRELLDEAAAGTGRVVARGSRRLLHDAGVVGRRVVDGELGIGPLRVRPQDVAWLRRQAATGLRSLLLLPEETAERLRTADPTTMARTLLALVGAEEALGPLPTPQEQIRQRFSALLDPGASDEGGLAPALLTITAQLSPDEARILRHLATTERAVVVAVDATGLTSRRGPTIADNLSVLVERAGGDHPERGPAYLDDLTRLGLCTVDWERDDDHPDVELIERSRAYREAEAAARSEGRRARRRVGTLVLTDLGRRLVEVAMGRGTGPEGNGPDGPGPRGGPPPVPTTVLDRRRPDGHRRS